jgi:hypothetical protein
MRPPSSLAPNRDEMEADAASTTSGKSSIMDVQGGEKRTREKREEPLSPPVSRPKKRAPGPLRRKRKE